MSQVQSKQVTWTVGAYSDRARGGHRGWGQALVRGNDLVDNQRGKLEWDGGQEKGLN